MKKDLTKLLQKQSGAFFCFTVYFQVAVTYSFFLFLVYAGFSCIFTYLNASLTFFNFCNCNKIQKN